VAGQQGSDGCATQRSNDRADRGNYASRNIKTTKTKDIRRAGFRRTVYRSANPRSCASAYRGADEGVVQTLFVFHEFHATNVVPLDRLLA
jgi:hypothetical protein